MGAQASRSILRSVASLCPVMLLCFALAAAKPSVPVRPDIVQNSIDNKEDIYYFGLGSNMLKSKVEGRSICGNKIHVKSMGPAIVKNHRLAFNMKGFPPLEPGMGSLEPVDSKSTPLLAYKEGDVSECHGALIRLSAEDYDRLMKSEGVGHGRPDQGYEEIVVEAFPYNCKKSVQAISLRARDHVRLKKDAAPSPRYMPILKEGAEELKLKPCYVDFLKEHPVSSVPPWMRKIAICNPVWTAQVSFRMKFKLPTRIQSALLWSVYAPPTAAPVAKLGSNVLTTAILLIGSAIGYVLLSYQRYIDTVSPMIKILAGDKI
ncbi:hypothetical protein ACHAWF_014560 [Thalassiosira exigua]